MASTIKASNSLYSAEMSATALLNLAKFQDRDVLIKVILDPHTNFFKTFETEIRGASHDKVMAILHVFKTLFSAIVEFHDKDSITILERTFKAPFFESDVRDYLDFVQKIAKNVKKDHLNAIQGYYFYLQNLDKCCFKDREVRSFLETAFPVLYETVRSVRASGAKFELQDPKERECQKPIHNGLFGDETKDGRPMSDFEDYGSFRDIPILPTRDDIMRDKEDILYKNLVDRSYRNIDHYLATQYRLLREVLVRPLREAIQKVIAAKKKKVKAEVTINGEQPSTSQASEDVRIPNDRDLLVYHDVQFMRSQMTNACITFTVKFDVSRLKWVDWAETSRLLPGSILCLSCDYFDTILFAAVAKRDDEIKEGMLDIFFFLDSSASVNYFTLIDGQKYLAVESVTYYEAYRHSLQALKDFNWIERFPFKKYIVDVSSQVDSPAYLKDDADYDLSDLALAVSKKVREDECTVAKRVIRAAQLKRIDIHKNSPEIPWDLMDLDKSQFEAVHAALTREFVVIQGPPGTGKTYVALRIVQVLLRNKNHWMQITELVDAPAANANIPDVVPGPWNQENPADPNAENEFEPVVIHGLHAEPQRRTITRTCPILILAYKNHALDQFLEGISRFVTPDKIVRVGGRSDHKIIKKLSLYYKRSEFKKSPEFNEIVPSRERQLYGKCMRRIRQIMELLEKKGKCYKQIKQGFRLAGTEIVSFIEYLCEEDPDNGKPHATKNVNLLITNYPQGIDSEQVELSLLKWLKLDRGVEGKGINAELYKRMPMEMVNFLITKTETKDDANKASEANGANGASETQEEAEDIYSEDMDHDGKPTSFFRLKQRQIDPDEFEVNQDFRGKGLGEDLFVSPNLNKETVKRIPKNDDRRRILEAALFIKEQLERNGPNDLMTLDEIKKIKDIDVLSVPDRWRLYRYWVKQYADELNEEFRVLAKEMELIQKDLIRLRSKVDYYVCRDSWIIGMTTTGAAKYRQLVELLKPRIVIVEEAAEVVEGHIISALTSCTEHLIMIGDHQQLRPIVGIQELALKYQMEISLFERMVINEMACYQLKKQHRMRPTISQLLRPHIYKELYDHDSVHDYENVKFTKGKNVFFLTHTIHEDRKSAKTGFSCSNTFEAEFVVELARYFLLRGVPPDKITILTTYNAQLEKVKQYMLKYRDLFEKKWDTEKHQQKAEGKKPKTDYRVRASTVDGFQGEENDIVIISFVRSSEEGEIGFLRIPNRVCVALSRAKKGLFCVGNFEAMEREPLWANIIGIVRKSNAIGHELKLGCSCNEWIVSDPKRLTYYNTMRVQNFKCSCTK